MGAPKSSSPAICTRRLLPSSTRPNASANWAGADVTVPTVPPGNRDGLQNFNATGIWDTGISEGQTASNNGGYDVWDISGPTRLADLAGTGATYALYEDISPNGWNLGWYLILTEIAPDGTTKYLSNKMSWQTGTNNIGIPLFYNPKAVALAMSTDANFTTSSLQAVPELSKNESTGAQNLNYANVTYASWANSPDYSLVGHIIHSMRTKHMGDNLWYCEKEGIEPDAVGYLISKGLKQKIEANARDLNFLPKQAQLPV